MKTIRTWVYAFIEFEWKIVVIKKSRWPFTGKYDLPWWKIEHWESNIDSLKRELNEELWLNEKDFKIEKLLTIEEDFVKHIWNKEEKYEHIIAIIYKIILIKNIDLTFKENNWDSSWIYLIENIKSINNTNILNKLLK